MLAIRAYTGGHLDFSEAYPLTKNWVIKERIVLNELKTQNEIELYKLRFARNLAAAQLTFSPSGPVDNLYRMYLEQSKFVYNEIGQRVQPWFDNWETEEKAAGSTSNIGLSPEQIADMIMAYRRMVAEEEKKKEKSLSV